MSTNYDDYLNTGTKKLMDFFSAYNIGEEEKAAIVEAISGELSANVADAGDNRDYENIIYNASLAYIDERLSDILSESNASYDDYESAIGLCNREKNMLMLFAKKNWEIPRLVNSDIDKCLAILQEKQSRISLGEKIIDEDKKIDDLIRTAQLDYSVSACDSALLLINELTKDIGTCKKKKVPIPSINNSDVCSVTSKINSIRKDAVQKDAIHKKLLENDQILFEIFSQAEVPRGKWSDIVTLCQKQIELNSGCKKKGWPVPTLKINKPDKLISQYEHYQSMVRLDKEITQAQNNEKQYDALLEKCSQQMDNIKVCGMNQWKVPYLLVKDPASLIYDTQQKKNKRDKRKKRKRRFIAAIIIIIVLLGLALFAYLKYAESKARIPFEDSYVAGKDLDLITEELENAGFKNIIAKSDSSSWLDDEKVISVSIDNQLTYKKGHLEEPDVRVLITYSSTDRIYVTDLLDGWKSLDYESVVNSLKQAGLVNISTEEVVTSDSEKNHLVASINLNGEDFTNEHCYLPQMAPVKISYYVWKINIVNSSKEFIGQDYREVVNELNKNGFSNIQTEEIHTGWAKGNTVVGVNVDNQDSYDSSATFDPAVKIIVKYSSDDRIDATSVVEQLNDNQDLEGLQKAFLELGFSNVTVQEEKTYKKAENSDIKIMVGEEPYDSGDFCLRQETPITIARYTLYIKMPKGEKDYRSNKEKENEYKTVSKQFEDMGFSNITLKRKNDLRKGWFAKEGEIDSIIIDGNDGFETEDEFRYDKPVVIVVHTFKDSGCSDITEIAE